MRVFDLDELPGNEIDIQDVVKILDFDTDSPPVKILLEGPPGPAGPQGPSGAVGLLATVTGNTSIPTGQVFTRVNATADCSVILPLASSVFVSGLTKAYTVKNISAHKVTLLPSGSDQIEFSPSVDMSFQYESLTLMATSTGWEII